MRYALRNQAKIKDALGETKLKTIIASLNNHFIFQKEEAVDNLIDSTPYPILVVRNVHENGHIAFYLTGRMYDVNKLAFKEFIDGHIKDT